ncbi:hypothetical protein CERSUDRAFT_114029 [Gelatoporia subvermispora B]|uniref:F-box domain-containing protein n=1 Tax=Ceriporiopsis subvermispora (strain B) TaxID=914234 RepID=M2RFW6_CERS8|nr:hypothetical protein CERSUDRAFT_114029 [Gelatoporia subvermispora B]
MSWQKRPASLSPFAAMPTDILLEITTYLTRSDALHLSLASSGIYFQTISALYASVELHGPEQCDATLGMLEQCPAVARHVRKLVVRPEKHTKPQRHDVARFWDNARVVSRLVRAAAPNLDALQVFEWDGEDLLPDDRMWHELRTRCLGLRYIGTTFGCYLPSPTSDLFHFNDLLGFSLTFKDGFYAHQLHLPSRESEPVFTRLWDMLVHRCPNLESLSLAGTSTEPSDAARLCSARWPRLRKLTIGDVVFGLAPPLHAAPTQPFLDFLERHPTLEGLHIVGHPGIAPVDLAELDPNALPGLRDFSGSLDHLRTLLERGQTDNINQNANAVQDHEHTFPSPLPLAKSLRRLCVPEPMQLRELTPLMVARTLTGLHSLTALKVTFALQSGYDSSGVFRTIVASCPHLLHLDLTCACKPSFYLESFSRSLRSLTRLRTLRLAIVKVPGEEPLHSGAARIALANPRLAHFAIEYIAPAAAAHPRSPPLEAGRFELVCDAHGLPVALMVSEWRAALWGGASGVVGCGVRALEGVLGAGAGVRWTRSSKGWTRRWVCDLRPSGHPDVVQKGWGQLLLEKGPAGEEVRLLVFCVMLVSLALWGVLWRAAGYRLFSLTPMWKNVT